MEKRRVLALLLSAMLIIAVFSGCGEKEAKTEDVTPDASQANEEPHETPETGEGEGLTTHPYPISLPLVEEPVEFTLWTTINPNATPYIDSLSDAAVYKHLNEITNVHMVATCVSAITAAESFQIMVGSGEWPDVCERVSGLYAGGLNAAYEDEFIIAITDYVKEYSPNYYARLEEDPVRMIGACAGGDDILTFAEIWDEFNSLSKGLAIRQDWLDELGLDVPCTYEELENVLRAFREEKGADSPLWLSAAGTGGGFSLTSGYDVAMTMDPMGGEYPFVVKDGKVICGLEDPNLYDYLDMISRWYAEDLCYKDFMMQFGPATSFSDGAFAEFLNGEMGVCYLMIDDFPIVEEAGVKVTPMADITREPGGTVGIVDLTPTVSPGWCITADCDGDLIPLVCQWIDFLYTDEGAVMNSFGLENQSWVYDENGDIVYTDLMLNNPDNLNWKVLLTLYAVDTGPGYFLNDRNWKSQSEQQHQAFDIWKSNQDGRIAYPNAATMTQEEESEYASIMTEIETFAKEKILGFITGASDLKTEWESYLETLKVLNIDRVVEIKQAAYDRFISK